MQTIVSLVAAGMGVALVPASLLSTASHGRRLPAAGGAQRDGRGRRRMAPRRECRRRRGRSWRRRARHWRRGKAHAALDFRPSNDGGTHGRSQARNTGPARATSSSSSGRSRRRRAPRSRARCCSCTARRWRSQPTFDLQVPGRPDSSVMDWFAARGFDTWCMDNEGYGRSDKHAPDQLRHPERRRRPRRRHRLHPEDDRRAEAARLRHLLGRAEGGALRAAPSRSASRGSRSTPSSGPARAARRSPSGARSCPSSRRRTAGRSTARSCSSIFSRDHPGTRRRGDDQRLRRRDPRARRFGADRHLRRHVLEAAAGRSGEDHRADHRHARPVRRHRGLRRPASSSSSGCRIPTSSSR